jgi:hypothetical protein
LGLRELFEKFQQGMTADVIKDAPKEKLIRPILAAAYEAGETVLKLSNTGSVKPGDVLELRVPVAVAVEQMPKFSLVEELRRTGDLLIASADGALTVSSNGSAELETDNSKTEPSRLPPLPTAEQQTTMPWQQEAEAIAQRLGEIRNYRTCQIQVEAVLDNQRVQITPTWSDIPSGVEITKSRANFEVPAATFVDHIGLNWQVLVGEELISYSDYKQRVVLQQRGMNLDKDGEIVVAGVRLKDTMPAAAYELFLKGLEAELATAEVEIPHSNRVVRPDKAKLEMQSRYGVQVRSLINELFVQRGLIRDGAHGQSLVERPVKLLSDAIARVQQKGHEPDFANNSALIHSAVFGFVKEQTGQSWSEYTSEAEYRAAVALARRLMLQLREQLQWRSWR